ncbi:hypothetical protein Pmani_015379 [Petrolisthes manimaculis]|uniref:Uncharacterized protein n=1 Tax=Petrolisthes manimaculis TaxID=1843537 RepID=A0AAE1U7F4_9EUCA|nr:hypothetical protein Pmani_015379 [Petrolisthes manimaculis]
MALKNTSHRLPGLQTHEILAILENEDEDGDIVLHIPESEGNVNTDEDSDKSDDEATYRTRKRAWEGVVERNL